MEMNSEHLIDAASGYVAVRSALPPEQMAATLTGAVAAVHPKLALEQVQPMAQVVMSLEAPRRLNTALIRLFALGALALSITGMYAVVAFSVSMRAQETAVRMALGAQRTNIASLVIRSGAKLALTGCGLGVFASLLLSKSIASSLFEVSATDPVT